jgi:hypothetical protein
LFDVSLGARAVRITGSGYVTREPALLTGIVYVSATTGATVALHDGQDAEASIVFTLKTTATIANGFQFTAPVLFLRGMYASFSDEDNEATVLLIPLREPLAEAQ